MSADAIAEAQRVLNFLAATPQHGHSSVDRKVLREIMLSTDGELLAQGELWTIEKKNLGAGVYRVSLKVKP